jgi:hypothetical protein
MPFPVREAGVVPGAGPRVAFGMRITVWAREPRSGSNRQRGPDRR